MSNDRITSETQNNTGVLADISQNWLDTIQRHLKETSYIKYRNLLYNHILPELGTTYLSGLSTLQVEAFVRKKLKEGRKDQRGGLKEKTVKDIISVLREICLYGEACGEESPCRFDQIRMRQEESPVRILNRTEQETLGRFLLRDGSLTKTGILLSLYMGLRLGEVCALKKEHILFGEKVVQVRMTMQRIQTPGSVGDKKTKVILTTPKSRKSLRDIPIPPILQKRLTDLGNLPERAYLLTGSEERFIEPRTLENIFKRYLKECQMEEINYHALRHTFATRCVERGFDVKTLSEILGHASVNITLNRYVHSSMERKREHMQKLQETW